MWTISESTVRPDEVDTTSSRTTVYVRRNIKKVSGHEECPDTYVYEEQQISRSDWDLYSTIIAGRIDDVENALIELADIIAGGEE